MHPQPNREAVKVPLLISVKLISVTLSASVKNSPRKNNRAASPFSKIRQEIGKIVSGVFCTQFKRRLAILDFSRGF
jgi:hypothetical protein